MSLNEKDSKTMTDDDWMMTEDEELYKQGLLKKKINEKPSYEEYLEAYNSFDSFCKSYGNTINYMDRINDYLNNKKSFNFEWSYYLFTHFMNKEKYDQYIKFLCRRELQKRDDEREACINRNTLPEIRKLIKQQGADQIKVLNEIIDRLEVNKKERCI